MSILEAILCGAVQGACEFLPISSSGHLSLLHGLFGISAGDGSLAFDVLLHLGTLIAVTVCSFCDIVKIIRAFIGMVKKAVLGKLTFKEMSPDEKLALSLVCATMPMALAVFFDEKAEALSRYPTAVGAIMMINGIMLLAGGKIKGGKRKCHELPLCASVGVGLFQLTAIMPGLSRSGSTITGGAVFGLSREEAVKFSFLMSIPAIIGANIFEIGSVSDIPKADALPYAIGVITAAVVGFAAIGLIKKLARKRNFNLFGIYCVALGAFAVIYSLIRT